MRFSMEVVSWHAEPILLPWAHHLQREHGRGPFDWEAVVDAKPPANALVHAGTAGPELRSWLSEFALPDFESVTRLIVVPFQFAVPYEEVHAALPEDGPDWNATRQYMQSNGPEMMFAESEWFDCNWPGIYDDGYRARVDRAVKRVGEGSTDPEDLERWIEYRFMEELLPLAREHDLPARVLWLPS